MDQLRSDGLSIQFALPRIATPDLAQQVQQLIQQRGALRHITNESLREEIEKPKSIVEGFEDEDEGKDAASENESDSERPQARQERLWKAREEILQKLAYAQNEILSALDFVSLLLSGSSAVAQASMSPALKQHVPTGTVEGRTVEKQDIPSSTRQRSNQVSDGWKSESFRSAASKLDQAAIRLESEAHRQSKFWEQIASLQTQDWAISRLPSDSRAIGVHYGFSESSAQFRNRGFALLQQDESGNIELDPRSMLENPTVVQVSVIRDGVVTGSSQIRPSQQNNSDEDGISEQIRQARNAIFEDELFYEISRETRTIANQGARSLPHAVEVDVDTRTQIRLVQRPWSEFSESSSEGSDDRLAELIILNMRLLLLLEHSKFKQQRCRPPIAMSFTPKAQPEYAILRPVLANLRHTAAVSALRSVCISLKNSFKEAALQFEYQITETKVSDTFADIQRLRQPAHSLLTTRIENGRTINLDVETYLGSPLYGTVFRSHNLDFGFVNFRAVTSTTVVAAVDHLARILTLELISQFPIFEVLRPHSGEVTFRGRKKATAVVNVRPQRISLLTSEPQRIVYHWQPSGFQCIPGSGGKENKTLQDVIQELDSIYAK